MLRTIFTFNLREKILEGRVAIGTFDGINPCLVAATNGDKVLIHNPHEKSSTILSPSDPSSQSAIQQQQQQSNLTVSSSNKTFLNINQTIKSLVVGCLDDHNSSEVSRRKVRKDVLFIGTPTSILAYDVLKNSGNKFHSTNSIYDTGTSTLIEKFPSISESSPCTILYSSVRTSKRGKNTSIRENFIEHIPELSNRCSTFHGTHTYHTLFY